MSFRICLPAIVTALLFVPLATSRAAAEPEPTIKPFFRHVALYGSYLRYCDIPDGQIDLAAARKTVDQAFEKLGVAMTARAVALGVERAKAEREVAAFLKHNRRELTDQQRQRLRCPSDFKPTLAVLASDRFDKALKAYAKSKPRYDKPFHVEGTGQESFASPSTQERLVQAMRGQLGDCSWFEIKEVTLRERRAAPASELPVFVLPRIVYFERWTVICDGKRTTFDAQHARDSEGPLGSYVVRQVQ